MGKSEDAINKANEVLKIVDRTGFRLYEPEAELILAKAHLAQGDKEKAKTYATQAHEKAKDMHYHIIETEVSNLLTQIKS